MFKIKMSWTNRSVWSPKSHLTAIPFSIFQNWWSDSFLFCFLERNVSLSRVQFLVTLKHSSQFCIISRNGLVIIRMCGNLSINVFLPVLLMEMSNKLTSFFWVASTWKFPIIAVYLGFSSVESRKISGIVIDCFASTATSNSWIH